MWSIIFGKIKFHVIFIVWWHLIFITVISWILLFFVTYGQKFISSERLSKFPVLFTTDWRYLWVFFPSIFWWNMNMLLFYFFSVPFDKNSLLLNCLPKFTMFSCDTFDKIHIFLETNLQNSITITGCPNSWFSSETNWQNLKFFFCDQLNNWFYKKNI